MIKKSIFIWFAIIPLAILNGALRENLLNHIIGEKYALPVSGFILCLLIFIVAYIFVPRLGEGSQKNYWSIGVLWFILTIAFETIMGLFLGNTFIEIIRAYDVTSGNLWLVIVLFTAFAPWLVAKIKHII